jgi:hypothetical protein
VKNIDEFMDALGAVPICECLYGVETHADLDLPQFRSWLADQLEDDDALIVIELRPKLGQANQNISDEAGRWLINALNR